MFDLNRFVIVWNDGFPSTFHRTHKEAEKLLQALEEEGVSGRILSRKEYRESKGE